MGDGFILAGLTRESPYVMLAIVSDDGCNHDAGGFNLVAPEWAFEDMFAELLDVPKCTYKCVVDDVHVVGGCVVVMLTGYVYFTITAWL